MAETTRRYCPDGHIYQVAPTFEPCCSKARPRGGARTHCPQGHKYTEKNPSPCRECRRLRNQRRSQRRPQPNPEKRARVRDFIKLRDGGLCRYCGLRGQEVDHVVARCNNGPDDAFDNLVWSCKDCNGAKGREEGFTLKKERLYWHGRLVAPGSIFGVELMKEVEAQRRERQLAQGLQPILDYKQRQKTS